MGCGASVTKGSFWSKITVSDHKHPIRLMHCAYAKGVFKCAVCNRNGVIGYHCSDCRYDVHPTCARNPKQTDDASMVDLEKLPLPKKKKFERHEHELNWVACTYASGKYKCDACAKEGTGEVWHCSTCKFDLHEACAEHYMDKIQPAPDIHDHVMILTYCAYSSGAFHCYVCGKEGSLGYHCGVCHIHTHPHCMRKAEPASGAKFLTLNQIERPQRLRDPSHELHHLYYTQTGYFDDEWECNKCQSEGHGPVWHCASCGFELCDKCVDPMAVRVPPLGSPAPSSSPPEPKEGGAGGGKDNKGEKEKDNEDKDGNNKDNQEKKEQQQKPESGSAGGKKDQHQEKDEDKEKEKEKDVSPPPPAVATAVATAVAVGVITPPPAAAAAAAAAAGQATTTTTTTTTGNS